MSFHMLLEKLNKLSCGLYLSPLDRIIISAVANGTPNNPFLSLLGFCLLTIFLSLQVQSESGSKPSRFQVGANNESLGGESFRAVNNI